MFVVVVVVHVSAICLRCLLRGVAQWVLSISFSFSDISMRIRHSSYDLDYINSYSAIRIGFISFGCTLNDIYFNFELDCGKKRRNQKNEIRQQKVKALHDTRIRSHSLSDFLNEEFSFARQMNAIFASFSLFSFQIPSSDSTEKKNQTRMHSHFHRTHHFS